MAAVGVIKSGCKKSGFPLLPKNAKYKKGGSITTSWFGIACIAYFLIPFPRYIIAAPSKKKLYPYNYIYI